MTVGKQENDNFLMKSAIKPEEIERTRRRVRNGEKIRIISYRRLKPDAISSYGCPVVANVVAKYPNLVFLDNGESVTYAQLASYYRSGKRRCIK